MFGAAIDPSVVPEWMNGGAASQDAFAEVPTGGRMLDLVFLIDATGSMGS